MAFATVAPAPAGATLLDLLIAHRAAERAFDATEGDTAEEAAAAVVSNSVLQALTDWDKPATSPSEALEALRVIRDSDQLGSATYLDAMLDAAIGYLEAEAA